MMYAASAIAVNTVVRSATASSALLFTKQMFGALGIGGGGSLIGGVGALLAVMPFTFYRYGRRIRAEVQESPASGDEADRAEKGVVVESGEGVGMAAGDGQSSGPKDVHGDVGGIDDNPFDYTDDPAAGHGGGERRGESGKLRFE